MKRPRVTRLAPIASGVNCRETDNRRTTMSSDAGAEKVMAEPLAQAPREYAAFKIEQRGIDLIPDSEREMKPAGLFWLWAGGVFNVEFLFYGTLIMTFGLSVPQAVGAIIIGNLAYAFLGWASLQGPKTGTTAFMVSRAPFGQNGNRLVALLNWGTQVGFEIEGIYFVVATILLLFARYHTTLNAGGKIGIIVLAIIAQMALPLLGHATISKILRYLAYVFIVFFALLAIFTFAKLHLSTFHASPATFAKWTTALVVIISVGGLGWTENGNDYSRYLPGDTPGHKTFWAAALGAAIPSVVLELLGVLAYTVTTKTVGIAQLGIPQSFDSWFVVPFLIFAIFQLLAINTIDLYSSSVTLQALGLPVKRWGAVIIDSAVCGVVTGIILFHGNFYADFSGFLLYIVVWLSAWFGVFITDYLLRRKRYDTASLAAERNGLYWRNGGIHWPAVIALAAGIVAALMWINAAFAVPSYTGPISNHFPGMAGSDLSWAMGIVVSSLVYWALAARSVREEAAATESAEAPELTETA
jgi:nucleobase:cation symporter-1, NCS1 family